jgi:uncharacterized protein (DUF1501 family)
MSSPRANRIGCAEFRETLALNRRGFLRAGMLGCGGLTLAGLLQLEQAARAAGQATARQKSVIILWMRGGPSQHETWDPKPDAPQEYRGAFGAMRTKVPGIQICDHLPLSAGIMDKWSIVRSLYHTDAGHSRGDQICFTGYPPGPVDDQNAYPSCGSVVAKQLQHLDRKLPAYVMIPRNVPGTGAAYLGAKYAAFETGADPAQNGPFSVPNFSLSEGLSLDRLDSRRNLLSGIDRLRRAADASGQMETMDQFQQQAWDMVTNDHARKAFDLDAEPAKVRERYGFMPEYKAPTPDRCGVPAWSQRILLARRLVEAGVRLVTVDLRWWDTHVKGYETMRDGFLPRWDRAYTALIQDLHERGLMESTLVLAWGEFGRTPKVNSTGGRDHWPGVFSAALAGGGVKGGRVVGASDAKGGEPADNAKTPQDVLATVYRHLGIDVATQYADHTGRPHPVLTSGKPIDELFS